MSGRPTLTLFTLFVAAVFAASCGVGQPAPTTTPAGEPRIDLVSLSPNPPKVGVLDVTVRVLGPDGQPIDDQIERVRVVPEMVGMPTHTVEGTFTAQGNGVYTGQADVSAFGGTWQLKMIVELKDEGTIEQIFEIVAQY